MMRNTLPPLASNDLLCRALFTERSNNGIAQDVVCRIYVGVITEVSNASTSDYHTP
jgi:hypothetical protein